jgi:hypothetical protein
MRISPVSGNALGVSIAGQNIPMFALTQTGANEWLMGGDISSFAGQTQELQITAVTSASYRFGRFVLDDITFSSTPIPEPGSLSLVLCGVVALGLGRLAGRSNQVCDPGVEAEAR